MVGKTALESLSIRFQGDVFLWNKMAMTDFKAKWAKCCELIRDNLGEDKFKHWFAPTEAVEFDNGCLVLKVPSNFYRQVYEDHFYGILSASLKHVFGNDVQLLYEFEVVSNDKESTVKIVPEQQSKVIKSRFEHQFSNKPIEDYPDNLDSQLNPALNFENYCVGKSNRLPFTIADHIATHPEKADFNPFFIYGNVGVGKTHLIQAIGIRIKERNPRARVLFLSMRHFQNLYYNASVVQKKLNEFINYFQTMDVLIFDDIQELAGKTGTAEALFPIFNHLHAHNKKLIFSCDRPPMELDGISDRLIDRFKWGITERLENPDFELRKQILTFKAAKNGLDLSEEIIEMIARSAVTSIRELEGIVMGIYMRSISQNAPIDTRLAKEVLDNLVKIPEKKTINFEMIVENTAEFYGLNPDAIFSKSRLRDIADARQMIMYLCKKHTGLSYPAIGAKLNRRHPTVVHAIKTISDRLAVSPDLGDAVAAIEKLMLA